MNVPEASPLRVGMIGTGGMGTAGHLHALRQIPNCQIVAACDVNAHNLALAAERYSIPRTYTDFSELLAREELDVVDVATPNVSHAEISIAALKRGVPVICEKPMAMSRFEAREMLSVARERGLHTAINFSYRYVPAARFIREIIQSGEIGEVHHVVATYNQGWLVDPASPLAWRLKKSLSGTGVLGDLGSHLIDLARFWGMEFSSVLAHLKTFVTERPLPTGAGRGSVDVDDAAGFLVEFASGATGTFFTTRYAYARANSQRAEIYGTKGGLVYDNERPNEVQFSSGSLMARHRQYATMSIPQRIVHESTSTMQQFVEDIGRGTRRTATFEDGVVCQEILDGIERSAERGSWVRVPLD